MNFIKLSMGIFLLFSSPSLQATEFNQVNIVFEKVDRYELPPKTLEEYEEIINTLNCAAFTHYVAKIPNADNLFSTLNSYPEGYSYQVNLKIDEFPTVSSVVTNIDLGEHEGEILGSKLFDNRLIMGVYLDEFSLEFDHTSEIHVKIATLNPMNFVRVQITDKTQPSFPRLDGGCI